MTRNVVLLVLDCARADISREELTRLRTKADLVLDQCRAASPWSVPSHANLLTGELPHQHGVHAHNTDYETLSETFLDDLDHHTVGISANSYASSTFGFDTHFDEFHDVRPNRYFQDAVDVNACLGDDATPVTVLRDALSHPKPLKSAANVGYLGLKHLTQIAPMPGLVDEGTRRQLKRCLAVDEEPFFTFANLMEAHRPMYHHVGLDSRDVPYRWTSRSVGKWEIMGSDDPSEEFGTYLDRYRSVYRSSLRYMDRHVASFVDEIQERTDHETTVIVTADHGENLCLPGDDGLIDHVGTLNDSLLHVPLLVFNPPGGLAGERDDLVSHLDLPGMITDIGAGTLTLPDRDIAPAEVIGALGEPPFDAAYWDRAIRQCYSRDDVTTWDSLDEESPDIEEEHFDTDIRSYKRQAGGDRQEFDDATRKQLEELGYL